MTDTTAAPDELEASIEVSTSPAQTWALVSDLRRMREWSPQVLRTFIPGGPVRLGSRMINVNHRGALVWPTTAKVVRFEPHTSVAFRVAENRTIWSFTLEPTDGGGTRIVQRREVPDGISTLSNTLVGVAMGGVPTFVGELRQGMRQTLERIKAELER
ncbi:MULTISPECIES: SRPBCC family protein [Nocardioides]|uniref:SRPBCC family protein n=1 Tax=Nocardioides kribbensis TaxID=305517 RepID=A0ABV1NZD5_9ACTN|nr:SRPBCC family protein [Nocardioides sp. P86]MCM3516439.1 SRPBCC family protein [Nocardioides sp. P86]